MRFLLCLLLVASCVPAFAQTQSDVSAWSACTAARVQNHATRVTGRDAAIASLGSAQAALAGVPDRYRSQFQGRLDSISRALTSASAAEGDGDIARSVADGQYAVAAARVAAGQWLGVWEQSIQCANRYRYSTSAWQSASMNYGYVRYESDRLVQDIAAFLSRLSAFEDFYGPIP